MIHRRERKSEFYMCGSENDKNLEIRWIERTKYIYIYIIEVYNWLTFSPKFAFAVAVVILFHLSKYIAILFIQLNLSPSNLISLKSSHHFAVGYDYMMIRMIERGRTESKERVGNTKERSLMGLVCNTGSKRTIKWDAVERTYPNFHFWEWEALLCFANNDITEGWFNSLVPLSSK